MCVCFSVFLKANAIISYNNRPATEAVPYFEQVMCLVYVETEFL